MIVMVPVHLQLGDAFPKFGSIRHSHSQVSGFSAWPLLAHIIIIIAAPHFTVYVALTMPMPRFEVDVRLTIPWLPLSLPATNGRARVMQPVCSPDPDSSLR